VSRRRPSSTAGAPLAALALVAVVLVGCGGGDDEAAEATSTTTTTVEADPAGATGAEDEEEVDPTEGLAIEQESEALPASEVRLGARVASEMTGGGGDGSTLGGSSVSASEATAVERTLSELGATRTSEGLVVTLPETVLFDFDEADIRPDAAETLAEVAEVIEYHEGATIEVLGHTDGRGDAAYNQELSERRAQAVLDELVGAHGVERGRLEPRGYGATRPVAAEQRSGGGDDPDGRQRNRRVEILLREV
jgi:outer membrane protein OmpA-like peptidoglycan-associated protein